MCIRDRTNAEGKPLFTPLIAFGFILFILIYFPCMAVIAAIRKEAGWKWAFFYYILYYRFGLDYCFLRIPNRTFMVSSAYKKEKDELSKVLFRCV